MRFRLLSLLLFSAATAAASTLNVEVTTRLVAVGPMPRMRIDRVVFADEPLTVTLNLDVYAVPELPSTKEHLAALQRLTDDDWTKDVVWALRNADETRPVHPRLLSARVRHMGPGSAEPAAKRVPFTAYEARFSLPSLGSGTYTLQARVAGLEGASGPFVVATGEEPEYRDAYLDRQASGAQSYAEFRRLQLERLRLDPTKAGALLALAARSLEDGTLEETMDYYNRAVATMEHNVADYARVAPQRAADEQRQLKVDVGHIRALQEMLPSYFAQRTVLRVATDPLTGRYRLVERRTGRVVREEK